MEVAQKILSITFLMGGIFFFTTSTIGLLRFPDFFTRLHSTGKGDTLAILLSLTGLATYTGISLTAIKILLIATFMFFANPTATHAICRAAIRCGVKPWTKEEEKEKEKK